jgi:uncharacterized membrane protein YkoI
MTRKTLSAAAGLAAILLPAAAAAQPGQRPQVIGVPRAVAIAEEAGGRALEAELDYEKGRLVYEVTAASGKRRHELLIDAGSGEIVSQRPKRVEGLWRAWFDADQLNAVEAAPTPLATLLTRLENDTKVRVREVSLERDRGQTYYEVELADAGRHVLIDPRTGAVREGRIDD